MLYNLGEDQIEIRGEDYFVAENATVVGNVVICNNVSIWFQAVVRGDNDRITIGEESNIQDGVVLHTDKNIHLTLGKGVTVGHMAMLHGCTVNEFSLIGIQSVLLNGATIGKHCMIGAKTLVPEGMTIPDGSLVMGVPARVKRKLTSEEIAHLHFASDHYVQNFKRYKFELKQQTSFHN